MSMNNSRNLREEKEKHSLKGAFASVLLLGLFIAAAWLGVFVLFLMRG